MSIESVSFSYTYDDIMKAFWVLDKAKKDPRSNMLTIAMLGLIVYSLSLLSGSYAAFGIILAVISLYVIFKVKTMPMIRRKKTAKEMTKVSTSFYISFYENYIEITEKSKKFRMDYQNIKLFHSKDLILIISEGNLIVVPIRYMGENRDAYINHLKSKCKENFIQVSV